MPAGTARANDDTFGSRFAVKLPAPLLWLMRRPKDSIAGLVAAAAAVAILVNALFLQSGPHPAPIFSTRPVPVVAPLPDPMAALLPGHRATPARADAQPAARVRTDLMLEIQRELARRGFYEGPADGFYGPKTDAAIRDFEQAAGLRASAEPNEVLLASIVRSSVKAQPPAPPRDPIAALLAPTSRVTGVQRALNLFGYGPLKPTGVIDTETRSAIERFEKARKRPVTGQISDQLVQDLTALTGRPLE